MTEREQDFASAVFEHADRIPPEVWKVFWQWFDAVNLREQKEMPANDADRKE